MRNLFRRVLNTTVLFDILFKLFSRTSKSIDYTPEKPKVLLLVSDFLPQINGGTYRPLSWLQYSSSDVDINVVTSESKTNEVAKNLESRIPSNVKRFFVKESDCLYRIAKLFSTRPFFLISSYIFCLKLYKDSKPDIIVATGPDFSSFIVATALSKIFGSKLILDYRDEWVENPFEFVAPSKFDIYFERKCLEAASLVILTTESQKQQLLKKYLIKNLDDNVVVIPNGYEEISSENTNVSLINNTQYIISFAGALAEHTNPNKFLDFLEIFLSKNERMCDKLFVQFIGSKSKSVSRALDNYKYKESIISINQISPSDLKVKLYESNFLLLLVDERFKRYIPGKVYEYIAMKKPILVFGVDNCGVQYEIYSLLNRFSQVYFISNFDELNLALSSNKIHSENTELYSVFLKEYSRKNLARKFWDYVLT